MAFLNSDVLNKGFLLTGEPVNLDRYLELTPAIYLRKEFGLGANYETNAKNMRECVGFACSFIQCSALDKLARDPPFMMQLKGWWKRVYTTIQRIQSGQLDPNATDPDLEEAQAVAGKLQASVVMLAAAPAQLGVLLLEKLVKDAGEVRMPGYDEEAALLDEELAAAKTRLEVVRLGLGDEPVHDVVRGEGTRIRVMLDSSVGIPSVDTTALKVFLSSSDADAYLRSVRAMAEAAPSIGEVFEDARRLHLLPAQGEELLAGTMPENFIRNVRWSAANTARAMRAADMCMSVASNIGLDEACLLAAGAQRRLISGFRRMCVALDVVNGDAEMDGKFAITQLWQAQDVEDRLQELKEAKRLKRLGTALHEMQEIIATLPSRDHAAVQEQLAPVVAEAQAQLGVRPSAAAAAPAS